MSGVIEGVAKSWLTDQPWQKVRILLIINNLHSIFIDNVIFCTFCIIV